MDINNLKRFFRQLNSVAGDDQRREGWLNTPCPLAPWRHEGGVTSGKSFAATITPSVSKVHCFACNFSGTLGDLLLEYQNELRKEGTFQDLNVAANMIEEEIELSEIDAPDFEEPCDTREEIVPWPEDFLDHFETVFESEEAIAYLKGRQISQQVAKKLDLRWDWKRERICFPLRDYQGRLVGFHGRSVNPKEKLRYLAYKLNEVINPLVWLNEDHIDPEKPLLVVESVFDLASVLRIYPNSVCAMFAGLSKTKVRRLSRFIESDTEIVTLFDYGKGGGSARNAMNILDREMVHLSPTKEQGDPGDMTIKELKAMLGVYLDL